MNKEQAVVYLRFSGFSDEQIKAIEGAFTCEDCVSKKGVAEVLLKYAHDEVGKAFVEFLIGQINDLPSVNPQKPKFDNKVLKNIRLDIALKFIPRSSDVYGDEAKWLNMGLQMALNVIDKYKAERSNTE